MRDDTLLIFDTIRPRYFENIFENVEIVKKIQKQFINQKE